MSLVFAKNSTDDQIIHVNDWLLNPTQYTPTCPFCKAPLTVQDHYTHLPYFAHRSGPCEVLKEAEKLFPLLLDHWLFGLSQEEHQALSTIRQVYSKTTFHLDISRRKEASYIFNKIDKSLIPFYTLESLLEKGGIEIVANDSSKISRFAEYKLSDKALVFLGAKDLPSLSREITFRKEFFASLKMQRINHETNKPVYDQPLSFLKRISATFGNRAKRSPIRQKNREIYHQTLNFLEGKSTQKPDLTQVLKPADDRTLGKALVRKIYGVEGEHFLGHQSLSKINNELLSERETDNKYVLDELTSLFNSIEKNEAHAWKAKKKSLDYQVRYINFIEKAQQQLKLVVLKRVDTKKNYWYHLFHSLQPDAYALARQASEYLGEPLKMFINYQQVPSEVLTYVFNKYHKNIEVKKGTISLQMAPKDFKQTLYYAIGAITDDVQVTSHQSLTSQQARYERRGRKAGETESNDVKTYLEKEKSIQILQALSSGMSLKMIAFKKIGGYAITRKVLVAFDEAVNTPALATFVKAYRKKHKIKKLDFLKTNKKTILKG